MNIWLRVVGHDLGRTLMILDELAPTPLTSSQVADSDSSVHSGAAESETNEVGGEESGEASE